MQQIWAAHTATAGLILAGGLLAMTVDPVPQNPQGSGVRETPVSAPAPGAASQSTGNGALGALPTRPNPTSNRQPGHPPPPLVAVRPAGIVPDKPLPDTGTAGPAPTGLNPIDIRPPARSAVIPPAKPATTPAAEPRSKSAAPKTASPDEKPLKPDFSKGPAALNFASVGQMSATFRLVGFDLATAVKTGHVPRIAAEKLPPDWTERRMTAPQRKTLFFELMLPLVLIANDEIMADRQRLLHLSSDAADLTQPDRDWLNHVLKSYRLIPRDKPKAGNAEKAGTVAPTLQSHLQSNLQSALARIDIVPPALTLAQGAIESAWGRSRFAQQGNAMFGQWTWKTGAGIVPSKRAAGKTHEVRAFPTLLASVRAYMRNLNTSRAYRELRAERAELRAANRTLSGSALARHLYRYSEEGQDYVAKVRKMIRVNSLGRFDAMGLTDLL